MISRSASGLTLCQCWHRVCCFSRHHPLLCCVLYQRLKFEYQFHPLIVIQISPPQLIAQHPQHGVVTAAEILLLNSKRDLMLPADGVAVVSVHNHTVPHDERGFAAIRYKALLQQLQLFLVQRGNQIPEFGINRQVIQFLFRHSYRSSPNPRAQSRALRPPHSPPGRQCRPRG